MRGSSISVSDGESEDSEASVERSMGRLRGVAGALLLVGLVALGVFSATSRSDEVAQPELAKPELAASAPAGGAVEAAEEEEEEQEPRRLIDSHDFADLCIEHAMQLHAEADPQEGQYLRRLSEEMREEDRYLLEDGARQHFRVLLADLAKADPEAARLIEEARPTREQWNQVRTLVRALSDPRIRQLGAEAMLVANRSSDPQERERLMTDHFEQHAGEIRALRGELLPTIQTPPDVEGKSHWKVMASAAGLGASGNFMGWHARLVVGRPVQAAERLLRSLTKGRRLTFGVAMANMLLWIPLGIAVILPVLTIVMTLVGGPLQARIWTSIQGAVAGLTCAYATALQSALRGSGPVNFWPLWVPCGFNVALFGLESVWTLRVQRRLDHGRDGR